MKMSLEDIVALKHICVKAQSFEMASPIPRGRKAVTRKNAEEKDQGTGEQENAFRLLAASGGSSNSHAIHCIYNSKIITGMELQDQVCTLEQAKRLKELGVAQGTSVFAYIKNECFQEEDFRLRMVLMEGVTYEGYDNWERGCLKGYSAFTVAELGAMLPQDYHTYNSEIGKDSWGAMDSCDEDVALAEGTSIYAKTEAKCRAKMLIRLIENKLVSVEEINKRLQQ